MPVTELQRKARAARRWIRLHPSETLTILSESGRIPKCRCFNSNVEEPLETEELDFYDVD